MFKVGDVIKIREDLEEDYNSISFINDILENYGPGPHKVIIVENEKKYTIELKNVKKGFKDVLTFYENEIVLYNENPIFKRFRELL